MVESSAEEQRRILRERRAAKLKNGSSRLEKITGSTNSFLPTTSATDSSTSPSTNSSTPSITPSPPASAFASASAKSEAQRKKSNRISQTFSTPADSHHDDDPEINDISELINTSIPESNEPQLNMDDIMKSLFSSHAESHDQGSGAPPGMEDLLKNFGLFSQLGGESSGFLNQGPMGSGGATFEDMEHMQKVDMHSQQQSKQFRLNFTFLRYCTIALLYYTKLLDFETISWIPSLSIWDKFLACEILFLSYFFIHISNNMDYKGDSLIFKGVNMISGFLAPNSTVLKYLKITAKYNELFGLFSSDLSFLIVLFTLSSLFA